MNYKHLLYTALIFGTISFLIIRQSEKEAISNNEGPIITLRRADIQENAPPCLQMYYAIEKHADTYNIPLNYAYGIAYAETRYQGPFHWEYKNRQTSCVGAIGPMQIMLPTGQSMWPDKKVTRKLLMNDIEFNVETSMKLLRKLFDRYKDWKLVFGCYNTGRPCVNGYAERVYSHKINFKKH